MPTWIYWISHEPTSSQLSPHSLSSTSVPVSNEFPYSEIAHKASVDTGEFYFGKELYASLLQNSNHQGCNT